MKKKITAILIILWMIIIFAFSAQPAPQSSQISGSVGLRIAEWQNNFFRLNKSKAELYEQAESMQLYDETAPMIMKVPQAFISSLTEYFKKMEQLGKIAHFDFESLAMTVFSSTFGYTFLTVSFHQNLTKTNRKNYIKNSVKIFVDGISNLK